jgi:hypothetical protein
MNADGYLRKSIRGGPLTESGNGPGMQWKVWNCSLTSNLRLASLHTGAF